MPGFLDNYRRPPGSPPPFFSEWDLGGGMGDMGYWGGSPTLSSPAVLPPVTSTVPVPSTVPTVPMAGAGGIGGAAGALGAVKTPKLGLNFDTAQLALTGLSTIGNLWAAFQAQKLAKKQFNYTKDITETNLGNQIKTYNTALTDRANNRAVVEGRDAAYTKNYIDTNSLSRYGR